MDLNLLVAFDALMRERSVTRAGLRIGRTQPAMSAALSRLRHLLKDELFVRSAAGLRPTPRATELAEPIAAALAQLQQTLAFTQPFDPATSTATFTLAVSDHPALVVLPRLVPLLARAAPGVTLRVKAFTAREDAVAMLDAGEADAAVGVPGSSTPRILTAPMFSERFVCVLRRGHAQAKRRLTLERFLAMDHLLVSPEGDGIGLVDLKLAEQGRQRRVALRLPQLFAASAVITRSDLMATLMAGAVQASGLGEQLVQMPPPLAVDSVPFVLHWHRRSDALASQRWFREQVLAVGGELAVERAVQTATDIKFRAKPVQVPARSGRH